MSGFSCHPLSDADEKRLLVRGRQLAEGLVKTAAGFEGWKLHHKGTDVDVFSRDNESDTIHMFRARVSIDGDMEDFVGSGLMDTTAKFRKLFPKLDPMVKPDCEVLHAIPRSYKAPSLPFCGVKWARAAMPGPLWDRDFVMLEYTNWMKCHKTGEWCAVAAVGSIDLPDCPPRTDAVRATILCSGYVFRKGKKPHTMTCDYIMQADPAGVIPTWVVNMAASKQGMNVLRIKKFVEGLPAHERVRGPGPPVDGGSGSHTDDDDDDSKHVGDEEADGAVIGGGRVDRGAAESAPASAAPGTDAASATSPPRDHAGSGSDRCSDTTCSSGDIDDGAGRGSMHSEDGSGPETHGVTTDSESEDDHKASPTPSLPAPEDDVDVDLTAPVKGESDGSSTSDDDDDDHDDDDDDDEATGAGAGGQPAATAGVRAGSGAGAGEGVAEAEAGAAPGPPGVTDPGVASLGSSDARKGDVDAEADVGDGVDDDPEGEVEAKSGSTSTQPSDDAPPAPVSPTDDVAEAAPSEGEARRKKDHSNKTNAKGRRGRSKKKKKKTSKRTKRSRHRRRRSPSPEPTQLSPEQVCGLLRRGRDLAEMAAIDLLVARVVAVTDEEGGEDFLVHSACPVALVLGPGQLRKLCRVVHQLRTDALPTLAKAAQVSTAWLRKVVKAGGGLQLVVMQPSQGHVFRATWDSVVHVASRLYPDGESAFRSALPELQAKKFKEWEKALGRRFRRVNREPQARMTWERFAVCDRSPLAVRLFFFCELNIGASFTGDGWTRTKRGKKVAREWVAVNHPLSGLPDGSVARCALRMAVPAPSLPPSEATAPEPDSGHHGVANRSYGADDGASSGISRAVWIGVGVTAVVLVGVFAQRRGWLRR